MAGWSDRKGAAWRRVLAARGLELEAAGMVGNGAEVEIESGSDTGSIGGKAPARRGSGGGGGRIITAAARRGRGRRSPAGLTGGSLEEEREGGGVGPSGWGEMI